MGTREKKKTVPASKNMLYDYTHVFYVYSNIKAIPERRVAGNLLTFKLAKFFRIKNNSEYIIYIHAVYSLITH